MNKDNYMDSPAQPDSQAGTESNRDWDQSYTNFAFVYDTFMDNIPYDNWTAYLHGLLEEYGVKDGLLLDLGCGTGNMTERFADLGYDMIGIDNSEDMLAEAREKHMLALSEQYFDSEEDLPEAEGMSEEDFLEAEGMSEEYLPEAEEMNEASENSASNPDNIMYLLQDMRSFELYGTVAGIFSVCDSMNYLLEKEDLVKVFSLANNYLDPGGVFIFDFKTPYYYKYVTGNKSFSDNREDMSFIWENSFDEKAMVNIYDLTIFVNEDEDDENSFRRYRETHYQKAWNVSDFEEAAKAGGMKVLAVYDAFTHNAPKADSERIYMVVQEQWKEGKFYNE